MNNTAFYVNNLTKKSIVISPEEWQLVIESFNYSSNKSLVDKLIDVKVATNLLINSLSFEEESEQVAETLANG